MANLDLFVETFIGQIGNPDCSYLTGIILGQAMTFRFIIYLALIYIAFKAVDGLVLEPLLQWIKSEIKSRFKRKRKRR